MTKKNLDIKKLNEIYRNTTVIIKIHKKINRQIILKEKSLIINKINTKKLDIFNREKREETLIIEFKGKYLNQLEITEKSIIFIEEFENPTFVFVVDDILESIINIFRKSQ